MRITCRTSCVLLSAFCVSIVLTGCAGYQIGSRTLYRVDIQTIYVPMFESDSYRRWLGERLTEAVIKEIELRTPYKVVHTPSADSVLQGRIVGEKKRPLVNNAFDEPRVVELDFEIDVTWRNFQGDLLSQHAGIPMPAALLHVGQTASFVPEGGQSLTTAQQESIDRLARQIVGHMELPW